MRFLKTKNSQKKFLSVHSNFEKKDFKEKFLKKWNEIIQEKIKNIKKFLESRKLCWGTFSWSEVIIIQLEKKISWKNDKWNSL